MLHNTEYGCHKSGRDIVIAPYIKAKMLKTQALRAALDEPGGVEKMVAQKKALLFFSGDIRCVERGSLVTGRREHSRRGRP